MSSFIILLGGNFNFVGSLVGVFFHKDLSDNKWGLLLLLSLSQIVYVFVNKFFFELWFNNLYLLVWSINIIWALIKLLS